MAYKQRAFPYPVLNPYTDDMDGQLEMSIAIAEGDDPNVLPLDVVVSMPPAWDEYLIDHPGLVDISLDVYSPESLAREIVRLTLEEGKASVEIDTRRHAGLVSITPIVIATTSQESYSPNQMHTDFKDPGEFKVSRGDLLAFGLTQKIALSPSSSSKSKSPFDFDVVLDETLPAFSYRIQVAATSIAVHCGEDYLKLFRRLENSADRRSNLFISFYLQCLEKALQAGQADDDLSAQLHEESLWFNKLLSLVDSLSDEVQDLGPEIVSQALVADRGIYSLLATLDEGDQE